MSELFELMKSVTDASRAAYNAGHEAGYKQAARTEADLVNGINALLGLLTLVCSRDDMPAQIKAALQSSHRIDEAKAALAKVTP